MQVWSVLFLSLVVIFSSIPLRQAHVYEGLVLSRKRLLVQAGRPTDGLLKLLL